MKKCVACAEEILIDAKLCKYCETLQSDIRFAKPKVGPVEPKGDDVASNVASVSVRQEEKFVEPLRSPSAAEEVSKNASTTESLNLDATGGELESPKRSKGRITALVGVSAIAIATLGALAVGLNPSSPSPSEAANPSATLPTGENTSEPTPNSTVTAEVSESEISPPTPASSEVTAETAPVNSEAPSEPEKSVRSQLQSALDAWIPKTRTPKTATFVEEVGIFQGCPEDLCGPLTNFTISFHKFPDEFGNFACQVLLNVRDSASGKLLNRHSEDWALLGDVHVGISTLSAAPYVDGLPSSGLVSANELKVSCTTAHGIIESTKKFKTEIVISN